MTDKTVLRIGITGETGLIGRNLAALIREDPRFLPVPFQKTFFQDPESLSRFASQCDAVVHLAAVSRGADGTALYQTNMRLTELLADAVLSCPVPPAVCFGSTVQIDKDAPYHASKRDGAALLQKRLPCAVEMLMPNTFGPGARPYWNSVVSTFCEKASRGESPDVINDVTLELIGVRQLGREILRIIGEKGTSRREIIRCTYRIPLPVLWETLVRWKPWKDAKKIPVLSSDLERDLWETFLSYPYDR